MQNSLTINVSGMDVLQTALENLTRERPNLWAVWSLAGSELTCHYAEFSLADAIARQTDLQTIHNAKTEIEMYTMRFPERVLTRNER